MMRGDDLSKISDKGETMDFMTSLLRSLNNPEKAFFRKSLAIMLLITCLPTAATGVLLYVLGSDYVQLESRQTHQAQIRKAIEHIDRQLAQVELIATQWSLNPVFGESLRIKNFADEFEKTQELFTSLAVMKMSSPLIREVHIFLEEANITLSDVHGVVRHDPEKTVKIRELFEHPRPVAWSLAVELPDAHHPNSLVLMRKLPGWGGVPFGAFFVAIDSYQLSQLVAQMNADEQGLTLLVDEEGRLVSKFAGERDGADDAELESALLRMAQGKGEAEGTISLGWERENLIVSYGDFARLGKHWTYISAARASLLTEKVKTISRLILAIGALGMLGSMMLSWFGSRQIYHPIAALVSLFRDDKLPVHSSGSKNEIEYLEKQWKHVTGEKRRLQLAMEQQLPHLRESFLLQLFKGQLAYLSEADLKQRMAGLGWIAERQRLTVLFIQLSGYSSQTKFWDGDQQLATFAAANIVQEIAETKFPRCSVVNLQDLSLGVLIAFPREMSDSLARGIILDTSREWMNQIGQLLRMNLTVGVGVFTDEWQHIPSLFADCKQVMKYRNIREMHQLLCVDEFMTEPPHDAHYPFELEKEILHSLRMCQLEPCLNLFARFLDELSRHSTAELFVQQGIIHLLVAVEREMMQSALLAEQQPLVVNLYEQLPGLRDRAEIVKLFRDKVFAPFIQELREKQDDRIRKIVEHAIETIHTHYRRQDLSLEACADGGGVHPNTLSRIFKEITGTNFIDYLTQVRLKKSKELLAFTHIKITDIAEQVGYQHNYFNRLFKKHEHMTPGQYRDLNQQR